MLPGVNMVQVLSFTIDFQKVIQQYPAFTVDSCSIGLSGSNIFEVGYSSVFGPVSREVKWSGTI